MTNRSLSMDSAKECFVCGLIRKQFLYEVGKLVSIKRERGIFSNK